MHQDTLPYSIFMPNPSMPILAPVRLVPLSYDDREVVRLALERQNVKIYAAASVYLSTVSDVNGLVPLGLKGALILSRSTEGRLSVQLLDVSAAGTITWRRELTKDAALLKAREANEARVQTLSDGNFYVVCIFGDDEEAAKFSAKLELAVLRIAIYERSQQYHSAIGGTDSTDKTTCTVTMRGSADMSGFKELEVDGRDATSRPRKGNICPRDGVPQSPSGNVLSTARRHAKHSGSVYEEEKRSVNKSDAVNRTLGTSDPGYSRPESSIHSSKTWTCEIAGRTYKIPDLTNSLSDSPQPEEVPSREKFSGGFGVVWRSRLKNGRVVAIKTIIRLSDRCLGKSKGLKESKRFRSEAAFQFTLDHPNICPLLGIAESEASGLGASLVLPWMKNLDSLRYLQANPKMRRLPIIHGTISGVAFLHSKGVIHGDLKARNILISDNGTPLLTDFGLTSFAENDDRDISISLVQAGTPQWMATELIRSDKPGLRVTMYSDIWAFAMTVIEILTGDHPFLCDEYLDVIRNYELEKFPRRPKTAECSGRLWGLVRNCWALVPTSRPTAEEALSIIDSIVSCTDPNA